MSKADNKLGGARNFGVLDAAPLALRDKFKPTDVETLYRFGLDKSSSFNLSLSGLAKKTNADVELYRLKRPTNEVINLMGNRDFRLVSGSIRDNSLALMATSKRKGNKNENLALSSLEAGDYVVRVWGRSGTSRYRLQVAATATAIVPPIVTPPTVTPPTVTPPIKERTKEKLVDTIAPTAILNAANFSNAGGNTYDFTITYNDDSAINIASLDGSPDKSDIQVTGPNGFSQWATFVSVNDTSNGTPRVATYRITAPGGTWNSADNGSYTIELQGNQVSDTSGNFADAASLGSFLANIPLPRRVLQASGDSDGSIADFSFTINTKVTPQGQTFPQAVENFQIKLLRNMFDEIVASNIDLGSASIVSSSFETAYESGVDYTATFANYSGNLLDGGAFTLSSNQLFFHVATDDLDAVNSLLPLESFLIDSWSSYQDVYNAFLSASADGADANGNDLQVPDESALFFASKPVVIS